KSHRGRAKRSGSSGVLHTENQLRHPISALSVAHSSKEGLVGSREGVGGGSTDGLEGDCGGTGRGRAPVRGSPRGGSGGTGESLRLCGRRRRLRQMEF